MNGLTTIIGVALAIVGGTIQSFGFTMQKKGHNQVDSENEDKKEEDETTLFHQKIWLFGIAVYSTGGIIAAMALNFTAQSIISPLSAINLATNTVLSYFILKESISKKDIIAIAVIIIGSVFTVVFGPSSEASVDVTVDTLRTLFERTPYIICVSVMTALAALDAIGLYYFERKNRNNTESDEFVYGNKYIMFSYTLIAAYFASLNTLFIKSLVTIIGSSFESKQNFQTNFTDYLTYLVGVLWVICLFSMEYFRQKALSHFGALYVVPIFSVSSIILSTVLGAIYFKEFDSLTVLYGLLFGFGIIVTLCGVTVLSYDIGKLLAEFDDFIKVSFVDKSDCGYRYPKKQVYGGPSSEYWQMYFFKKDPVSCKSSKTVEKQLSKQMDGKKDNGKDDGSSNVETVQVTQYDT